MLRTPARRRLSSTSGHTLLVVVAIGGDGGGVVAKLDRQNVASHAVSLREILYFTGKVNVISHILPFELC
jgi:hypothetical protein